jgi:hypothetical protein
LLLAIVPCSWCRINNLDSVITNANSWASTVTGHTVSSDSIASGTGAITVTILLTMVTLGAAVEGCVTIVVTDAETETSWGNVSMAKEEEGAKDRFRKHIEDTIESRFRIW